MLGKYLKGNKPDIVHLAKNMLGYLFVLGHYLFFNAHSFPRAMLAENCLLLATDHVHRQISEHISVPIGDYCLYVAQV